MPRLPPRTDGPEPSPRPSVALDDNPVTRKELGKWSTRIRSVASRNRPRVRSRKPSARRPATEQAEYEGKADKIAGKVQKGFGDVKQKIKDLL